MSDRCDLTIMQNLRRIYRPVLFVTLTLKQAGYQLAIASGRNRVGLNNALQETGIGDLFSATRCAEETASKPNPLMLEEIMQHIGISSERTLMIGDSTHDLQMAKNAQVASIGVTCGVQPRQVGTLTDRRRRTALSPD